jgi:hypothetical protein
VKAPGASDAPAADVSPYSMWSTPHYGSVLQRADGGSYARLRLSSSAADESADTGSMKVSRFCNSAVGW